jgi:hypothetical protein
MCGWGRRAMGEGAGEVRAASCSVASFVVVGIEVEKE